MRVVRLVQIPVSALPSLSVENCDATATIEKDNQTLQTERYSMCIRRTASILVAIGTVAATLPPPTAYADLIVFQSRVSFGLAIDGNPGLARTVEAWDTYPALTVFPDGATVNGITYAVSTGDALVVNTGISQSPEQPVSNSGPGWWPDPLSTACGHVYVRIQPANSGLWHHIQQHFRQPRWGLLTDHGFWRCDPQLLRPRLSWVFAWSVCWLHLG